MTEKRYVMNAVIILAATAVLMIFIFMLVAHHVDMPNRAQHQRISLLGSSVSADDRIKPVGQFDIAAAAAAVSGQEPAKVAAATAAAPARDGAQIYQASCVACHGAGIAGAPKVSDKGQWAKRIAKGIGALHASAVNGMQSAAGVMPAKGGNPTLSDAEVHSAVDYMVAQSK